MNSKTKPKVRQHISTIYLITKGATIYLIL